MTTTVIVITLVFIYILCGVVAYHLFVDDWTRIFDYTEEDKVFVLFLSLGGPISLAAAVVCWLIGMPSKTGKAKIIKARKPH